MGGKEQQEIMKIQADSPNQKANDNIQIGNFFKNEQVEEYNNAPLTAKDLSHSLDCSEASALEKTRKTTKKKRSRRACVGCLVFAQPLCLIHRGQEQLSLLLRLSR